jgi:hypothetical protein
LIKIVFYSVVFNTLLSEEDYSLMQLKAFSLCHLRRTRSSTTALASIMAWVISHSGIELSTLSSNGVPIELGCIKQYLMYITQVQLTTNSGLYCRDKRPRIQKAKVHKIVQSGPKDDEHPRH